MQNLTKISISNIRKFDKDVEIPIEKGATIFLAPNGTGKTTIFEAIELGLTGKIRRLENSNLNTLVRDKYTYGYVKLEFGESIFNEVNLSTKDPISVKGNINQLFRNAKIENIPFLLRLTHLLDQQSNKWFVQSNTTEAGFLLQNLSIGKEIIRANEIMTGAKRAATQKREKAELEKENAKVLFQNWKSLLLKRDEEKINHSSSLKPIDQLINEIKFLIEQASIEKVIITDNIADLNITISSIENKLDSKEESKRKKLERFAILEQGALSYFKFEIENQNYQIKIDELEIEINDNVSKIQELNDDEVIIFENINKNNILLNLAENNQKQLEALYNHNSEVQNTSTLISTLRSELLNRKEKLDLLKLQIGSKQTEFERQKIILDERQKVINRKVELENLDPILNRWAIINREIIEKRKISNDYAESEKTHKGLADQLQKEIAELSKEFSEKLRQLEDISSINNTLKDALTQIILNHPKDNGECPLCESKFDPNELQNRMKNSLERLSPQLMQLQEQSQKTFDEIESKKNSYNKEYSNYTSVQSNKKIIEDEIKSLENQIKLEIHPKFEGNYSIEEAVEYLKNQKLINNDEYLKVETDYLFIETVSKEELENLENESKHLQLKIHELENEVHNLQNKINVINEKIKIILESDFDQKKNYQEEIHDFLSINNSQQTAQKTLIAKKEEINLKLQQLQNEKTMLKESLASNSNTISKFIENWKLEGFENEINLELLKSRKEDEQIKLEKLYSLKSRLSAIKSELAGWSTFKTYFKTQEEIDLLRATKSEVEYESYLQKEYEAATEKYNSINANSDILNTLSREISSEIGSLHDRLQLINPYWKKLLSRTVVDRRFSETQLNSYSHYKKQHASVNLEIHGNGVPVSDIASEAQLTDLQLTFLLSMAHKYQWSDWKGLLLDDPTQHHDLVHAAGVFDLLRDYILDHDFQILMTTHDPVQAKFFSRKLQNEGIPVKVWGLKHLKAGVNVSLTEF